MMEMARDIGRHDAQIETLQSDMAQVKNDVHEIKMILAQAQGSWKTLLVVGSVAAFAGSIVTKFLDWLFR